MVMVMVRSFRCQSLQQLCGRGGRRGASGDGPRDLPRGAPAYRGAPRPPQPSADRDRYLATVDGRRQTAVADPPRPVAATGLGRPAAVAAGPASPADGAAGTAGTAGDSDRRHARVAGAAHGTAITGVSGGEAAVAGAAGAAGPAVTAVTAGAASGA